MRASHRVTSFTSPTVCRVRRRRWRTGPQNGRVNARRVLFVGRFDRQKGVDVLPDALARTQVSTSAWLVGAPYREMACSVMGLSRPSHRTFARRDGSRLQSWPRTTSSAEVLIVPSRREGFGLIAAEAMRAEYPSSP